MDENSTVKLVAKLNKLTKDGKLKWDMYEPDKSLTLATDERVEIVYKTTYKDKTIRIYECKYRDYYEEHDTFYWSQTVTLDICDDDGISLWKFPRVPGTQDLLESVKYQTSDIKTFINDILSE